MDDIDLAQTLFVSDEGEVRAFPEHAGKREVQEHRPERTPGPPKDGRFIYTTTEYHPVGDLPRAAQLALARLYREQEEARALCIAWYWLALTAGFPVWTEELSELIQRSDNLEWIRRSERPKKKPGGG